MQVKTLLLRTAISVAYTLLLLYTLLDFWRYPLPALERLCNGTVSVCLYVRRGLDNHAR